MCTLIVLYGLMSDYPILVLHNRYLGRGAVERPPCRLPGRRDVFCPVDVVSGGTWVGFNESGLLVAVTNQETEWDEAPARSRGLLALDLLEGCGSADEARGFLLDPDAKWDYRRGNFVVLDASAGWHVVWDRETYSERLDLGKYVVTTLTIVPGIEWTDRAERMWINAEKRRIRALQLLNGFQPSDLDSAIDELKAIAKDHGSEKGPGSICYHNPTGEYVQTSSTIMTVAKNIGDSRILYCPGNACENKYVDYSSVLKN